MLAALLLSASIAPTAGVEPFYFGGGGVNDLAAAIADYTKQPCAILMPGSGFFGRDIVALKEATITPSPENPRRSLLEGLKKEFGLVTDVEELNAFTFGFWPFRVLRRYWGDCTYGPFDAPAPGSITDSEGNKLVVRLRGNEVLAVKDMARQLRLDKRFDTHWFYQQLSLSLQANGVDRDQLLELVAATVGGTLTQTDLGVEVRFNPTVFAKRAARAFEYVERHFTGSDRGSRKARASVRFEVEVFQTISPDVLEEASRGQYSTVTVKIERDSKLWVLAVEAARLLDESISSSLDFERDWEYEIRAWDCLVSVIGWFRHNGTLTQVQF